MLTNNIISESVDSVKSTRPQVVINIEWPNHFKPIAFIIKNQKLCTLIALIALGVFALVPCALPFVHRTVLRIQPIADARSSLIASAQLILAFAGTALVIKWTTMFGYSAFLYIKLLRSRIGFVRGNQNFYDKMQKVASWSWRAVAISSVILVVLVY